jgi:hypothetical protein
MCRLEAGVLLIFSMVMTGCPSEFGKDGRLNKAAAKDMKENLLIIKRCSDLERQRVCANGQQNSLACRECGGPP